MSRHSIKDDIVSDVVGISKGELLPVERLYVAHHSNLLDGVNIRWLVDLYMECGCFDEAERVYTDLSHWRKLGDLSWMRDDLDGAFECYARPGDGQCMVFRGGPDWDRLIKLSAYREDWEAVVKLVGEAPISPGTETKRIFLGNTEVASSPYLELYAIALHQAGCKANRETTERVAQRFGIPGEDWAQLLTAVPARGARGIDSARKRCLPRFSAKETLSVPEALGRGATPRAERLRRFLEDADHLLSEARSLVRSFMATGQSAHLDRFAEIINATSVESVTQTFFLAALGNEDCGAPEVPPERLIRFYACHPVARRKCFGRYLAAKLHGATDLTGGDLVTGIFQTMALIEYQFEPLKGEDKLDFRKLRAYGDWAESELEGWLSADGEQLVSEMRARWQTANRASGYQMPAVRYSARADPREMKEWEEVVARSFEWLACRWESEFGASQWKSEELLFKLLRKALRGKKVIQHAQPIWLEPQHLDVFVPGLSLAVEYMGEQHYEPVDFFGGHEALKQTRERDSRKEELCRRCGIKLVYVRYDEDIAERVKEIRAEAQ